MRSITVLLLLPFLSYGQQQFTQNELTQDFDCFRQNLEQSHPALYWYRSKAQIDDYWDSLRHEIVDMNEQSYYHHMIKALNIIGCGHTDVSLSEETQKALKTLDSYFPARLFIDDTSAFFLGAYEQNIDLSPGDRILSINGQSMISIIETSQSLLSGDGFIETADNHMLNEYFSPIYLHFFGPTAQFDIQYVNHLKDTLHTTASGVGRKILYPERSKPNIELFNHNDISVIKIRAFFDWKDSTGKHSFDEEVASIFNEIEANNTQELIIDLRGNGGGRAPRKLFSFFIKEPTPFFEKLGYKVKKQEMMTTWYPPVISWFAGLLYSTKEESDTLTLITGEPLTKPIQPAEFTYQGRIVMLTDGGSFSAASDFSAMMDSYTKAIFVGEETGGGYYGNTSFATKKVSLPNSKLQLTIPMGVHTLPVSSNVPLGRGVIPDYPISPTLQDVLTDRDPGLEFACQLLRGSE